MGVNRRGFNVSMRTSASFSSKYFSWHAGELSAAADGDAVGASGIALLLNESPKQIKRNGERPN
jgi:hypothetical protein